jgi:hypothetical protein
MTNCHVHSIPVAYRWCFTFRRMTNCHVHSIPLSFQKNEKSPQKKKKNKGGGGGSGAFLLDDNNRQVWLVWQWYKNSVAQSLDLRRAGKCLLACSLYPLGTRAKLMKWSTSLGFIRSYSLGALLGPEFGSKFKYVVRFEGNYSGNLNFYFF